MLRSSNVGIQALGGAFENYPLAETLIHAATWGLPVRLEYREKR